MDWLRTRISVTLSTLRLVVEDDINYGDGTKSSSPFRISPYANREKNSQSKVQLVKYRLADVDNHPAQLTRDSWHCDGRLIRIGTFRSARSHCRDGVEVCGAGDDGII
jgi:hypothetical protein